MITRPFPTDHLTDRLERVIGVIDSIHRTTEPMTETAILDRQMFCFGEEAGEAIGAYRRLYHGARRSGTRDEFEMEIADCLIVLHILCMRLGIDPHTIMNAKLDIVEARGGR